MKSTCNIDSALVCSSNDESPRVAQRKQLNHVTTSHLCHNAPCILPPQSIRESMAADSHQKLCNKIYTAMCCKASRTRCLLERRLSEGKMKRQLLAQWERVQKEAGICRRFGQDIQHLDAARRKCPCRCIAEARKKYESFYTSWAIYRRF